MARRIRKQELAGWWFVSPWVLGFLLFCLYPFAVSLWWSLCRYDLLSPPEYVGAANYLRLVEELRAGEGVGRALWNTAYYGCLAVPLSIVVGIFLAVVLSWQVRGQAIYRTVCFLPSVVPVVASSILWIWLLDPRQGLVNHLLGWVGIPGPQWLNDSREAAWLPAWFHGTGGFGSKDALILMAVWAVGNFMVIYLAAIGDVPATLHEAAELDGAGRGRRFWHITLPFLDPGDSLQPDHGDHSVGAGLYPDLSGQRRNRGAQSIDAGSIAALVPLGLSRPGDGVCLGRGLVDVCCVARRDTWALWQLPSLGALPGGRSRMTDTVLAAQRAGLALLLLLTLAVPFCLSRSSRSDDRPGVELVSAAGRQEVVFWHFWGGADREVVDRITAGFNAAQQEYFVRAIAMPGNNLDMKLFLAVTGGDPPDLVNQDDPILADWAERGAIMPLDQMVPPDELARFRDWLFPAAVVLGTYDDRLYGVCNGLDVRALYVNQTMLDERGLARPLTIAQLDRIAEAFAPGSESPTDPARIGFLPNPKLLWSWGSVFGGRFYDPATKRLTLDDDGIVAALEWMAGYGRRYGATAISFRAKDQSLPGKTFPLLAGRYVAIVDGQWRVRDIAAAAQAARQAGRAFPEFRVYPLPSPEGRRDGAGWINGNFFVVPRGARQPDGAWAFIKYWIGFGGPPDTAARFCAEGGWIPVSPVVTAAPAFARFLNEEPLFRPFVELAGNPHQQPRPNIPGGPLLDREVRNVAERAMYGNDDQSVSELLREANMRLRQRLRERAGQGSGVMP